MKEMAALQPGMNFYGMMPDSYSLRVNTENPIVKKVSADADKALSGYVKPLLDSIASNNEKIKDLEGKRKDDNAEETKKEVEKLQAENNSDREELNKLAADYAKGEAVVGQLIDLALLANGMLRGEQLAKFIERSTDLLK